MAGFGKFVITTMWDDGKRGAASMADMPSDLGGEGMGKSLFRAI